jgi:hypothetical protein
MENMDLFGEALNITTGVRRDEGSRTFIDLGAQEEVDVKIDEISCMALEIEQPNPEDENSDTI